MGTLTVGFALTGSYCTFKKTLPEISKVKNMGFEIIPIISDNASTTDTRFGESYFFCREIEKICNNEIIKTIRDAEPIGPKNLLDALIVAPCTGNTLAKLATGVTDTSVTMAVKATLRNEKPVIIGVSTNDGLGNACKNLGSLLNYKNIYFVPFNQDDPYKKPRSLVCDMKKISDTLKLALKGEQIQPIIYEKHSAKEKSYEEPANLSF